MGAPSPVPGPGAIEEIAAERLRQIVKFSHSTEADDEAPLWHLLRLVRSDATGAIESFHFNKGTPLIRRRLVRLGALVVATIEKIDREQQRAQVEGWPDAPLPDFLA